jgi:hypothetical protein
VHCYAEFVHFFEIPRDLRSALCIAMQNLSTFLRYHASEVHTVHALLCRIRPLF